MKIKTKILISVVVIIIGALTFYGCNKDQEIKTVQSKTKTKEQRILSFIEKMNAGNTNLKSSEEKLQKDTALWNIEATLNYTYADAEISFENYFIDTSYVECSVTQDSISLTDVTATYNKIKDSISTAYSEINEQNKTLVVVDVFLHSVESSTATFGIMAGFNSGPVASSGVFGTDDWWKWGRAHIGDGGYCDGQYSGTRLDEDAATQIERVIRLRTGVPSGRYYYTDVESLEIRSDGTIFNWIHDDINIYNPNDITLNDNYYDYLMFLSYSEYPNHHACVSPDEMNFYLEHTEEVFKELLIDEFSELNNKSFISCDMRGEDLMAQNTMTYVHFSVNEYGIVSFTNDPKSTL